MVDPTEFACPASAFFTTEHPVDFLKSNRDNKKHNDKNDPYLYNIYTNTDHLWPLLNLSIR